MTAKEILELYDKLANDKRDKQKTFKLIDKVVNSKTWEMFEGKLPPGQKKPVTNIATVFAESRLASLSVTDYIGQAIPTKESDAEVVEEVNHILKYIWDEADLKRIINRVYWDGLTLGTGVLHINWDLDHISSINGMSYKGKATAKHIPVSNFFPDPNVETIDECSFIHLAERKTVEELKTIAQFTDGMARVEAKLKGEYYEAPELNTNPNNPDIHRDIPNSQTRIGKQVILHTHYRRVTGSDPRIEVYYVVEGEVIFKKDRIHPNKYPFVVFREQNVRSSMWGISSIEKILPLQLNLTELESIIATHVDKQQNPIKLVSAESGINVYDMAVNGDKKGHTFKANGDPSKAVNFILRPDLPPALYERSAMLIEQMKYVAGINDFYGGESSHSIQTKGGIDQMLQRATLRDGNVLRNMEWFLKDLTVLLWNFIQVYGEFAYIRFRSDINNKPVYEFREVNWEWVREATVDFTIDVEENTPRSKLAFQEAANRMMELEMQYPAATRGEPPIITIEEWLVSQPFPQKDQILARMREQRAEMEQQQDPATIAQESITLFNSLLEQGATPDVALEEVMKQFDTSAEQGVQ